MLKERACANSATISRRTLLISLPVLAVPASAQPGSTEILCLFHQHQAIKNAARDHVCTATGKDEDEELEHLFFRHTDRLEADMMALPSTCAADMAAKMIVAHANGEFSCLSREDPVWVEARRITTSLLV